MSTDTTHEPQMFTLQALITQLKQGSPQSEAATGPERRRSARRNFNLPVWFRPITPAGLGETSMQSLCDLNANGVSVFSSQPFAKNARYRMELVANNTCWTGDVRVLHCQEVFSGYLVGLVSEQAADTLRGQTHRVAPIRDAGIMPLELSPELEQNWLAVVREDLRRVMQAYRQARRTWGMLGTPAQQVVKGMVESLPGLPARETRGSRRRTPRLEPDLDVYVVVELTHRWRRVPARLIDVSEGGVGLLLPLELIQDPSERELTGSLRVRVGLSLIVGFMSKKDTIWVPAEIVRCSPPRDGILRVGAQFATKRSLDSIRP